jgi:Immunity protein 40
VEIRDAGTSLRSQHVNEVAFRVALAGQVLDALRGTGVAVLGGDFWLQNERGVFRPVYENWYVSQEPSESDEHFAVRSIDRAKSEVGRRQATEYSVTFTCKAVH